jgi:hypothetical protein
MGEVVLGALIIGASLFSILRVPKVRGVLRRGGGHPGVWLLAVIALIYLNQMLVTVYLVREHGGDTGFIARYLPPGWFDLADLGWFTRWFPAPDLLSWSLLRVSSFLELPFGLFAYLTVCRWLDADVYRRAVRLTWAASFAYSITFMLIEWTLYNPYTVQNLVIRAVSAIVVPLWVSRFAGGGEERVRSLADLLLFVVSAGALGYLVLVVYDTALLYNLGHVPSALPGALVAVAVLVAARLMARKIPESTAGPALATLISSLGWFFALFFVPALSIRYGLIFGLPVLAAVAGVVVTATAVVHGVGRQPNPVLLGHLAVAVVAGLAATAVAYAVTGGYPEARVLAAAGAFFLTVTAACTMADRLRTNQPAVG